MIKKKNGFTLVELLAVIVVLAIILLIAAPKIQTVIESSRQSSIEATAKVLASNAEMIYANKKLLNKNYNPTTEPIQCSEVAKLSGDDYGECRITFNSAGEATVYLTGIGSFDGYYCESTSDRASCTKILTASLSATTFANDSWETIKSVIIAAQMFNSANPESNSELAKYHVGDTKTITVGGNNYTVRVVNNSNYNCTLQSKTACGFVVEFADSFGERPMNTTNTSVGGWRDSAMREYLNGEFYNSLPTDLKNSIKMVNVVSGYSYNGGTNFVTQDKVYLLSGTEKNANVSLDSASDSTRAMDQYPSRLICDGGPFFWLRNGAWGYVDEYFAEACAAIPAGIDYPIYPAFRIG